MVPQAFFRPFPAFWQNEYTSNLLVMYIKTNEIENV